MTAPEPPVPWSRALRDLMKAAPTAIKVIGGIFTLASAIMWLLGLKVVSVPMMEVSRLSAQGMVFDTAIKSIRADVNSTKWEFTNFRIQMNDALRPGLVDLCLSRSYDQVIRMKLNCDSLGVVKRPPR